MNVIVERNPDFTLAVIVEDPDAPKSIFDHWIVWNIPVDESIEESTSPA